MGEADDTTADPDDAAEPTPDAAPTNPLEALGLGPMWRPTPAAFMWRRLSAPAGDVYVLSMFNVGGSMGVAFSLDELEGFVAAATKQLEVARSLDHLVKPPAKQLILPGGTPNRQQRRHPNG